MKPNVNGKIKSTGIWLFILLLAACTSPEQASTAEVEPTDPPTGTALPTAEIPSPSPTQQTRTPEIPTSTDDDLRVSMAQNLYSLSDTIRVRITGIGSRVYFIGPCDRWFERQEGQDWVMVGQCPESNFTDEPYSIGLGETFEFDLPMSRESEYLYSYSLTPGTYRLTITYRSENQPHTIYSPEFKITE